MSTSNRLHNLPPQPTTFVGRTAEIEAIGNLLSKANCRLLTLVGSGGIGKSRLALEVAKQQVDDFSDGIYYIPLAPLNHEDDILPVMLRSLGLYINDVNKAFKQLLSYISECNLLLILDNCEHLLQESADIIADILKAAPDVKIMVTSRERIGLQSEWVREIHGLSYPIGEDSNNRMYDALELFFSRALQLQSIYSRSDLYDHAIQICQLVEGMPLAIELAVAWLRSITPTEIVTEIEHNLHFLKSQYKDMPYRHRSIQTVFESSWSLCTLEQQATFSKLSVFRGGFTRSAAEQVAEATLQILADLVEKSMIRKLPDGRYEQQKLVQQFAHQKLQSANLLEETQLVHAIYFADLVYALTSDIKGLSQIDALNDIKVDFDNIHTAWQYAIKTANFHVLDKMSEGLTLYCDMRAYYNEGLSMMKDAIDRRPETDDKTTVQIYHRLLARWIQIALLFENSVDPSIEQIIQPTIDACLKVAQDTNNRQDIALCTWLQAEYTRSSCMRTLSKASRLKALPIFKKAQNLFRELNDLYYLSRALHREVSINVSNDIITDTVKAISDEQIAICRQTGDLNGLAHAYLQANKLVDDAEALYYFEQCHILWQQVGDRKSVAVISMILAQRTVLAGEFIRANEYIIQSYDHMSKIGIMYSDVPVLQAMIAVFLDDTNPRYRLDTAMVVNEIEESHKNINWGILSCIMGVMLVRQNTTHSDNIGRVLTYASDSEFVLIKAACLAMMGVYIGERGIFQQSIKLLALAFTQADDPRMGWMHKWQVLQDLLKQMKSDIGADIYQTLWAVGASQQFDKVIRDLLTDLGSSLSKKESATQPLSDPLTPKQLDVLCAMLNGKTTDKELAEHFVVAHGTVRAHIHQITQKLGVQNRTEAVLRAQQLDLC